MDKKFVDDLRFENARIIFRNFSGKGTKFNHEGDRNFCVVIDDVAVAEDLANDGWNVKKLEPRDDYVDPLYYIPVAINFDSYKPPVVWLVCGHSKTQLDKDSVGTLDFADIKSTDIILHPYCWEVNGDSGIKAYLKNMYVVIEEDPFAGKYVFDEEEPF